MNAYNRILNANAEWLERNGQSATPEEYAAVAMATTQIAKLANKKETAGGTAVESVRGNHSVRELEQFVERYKHNELELKRELGSARFGEMSQGISDIIKSNDLMPYQIKALLNHLACTFQAEHKRV